MEEMEESKRKDGKRGRKTGQEQRSFVQLSFVHVFPLHLSFPGPIILLHGEKSDRRKEEEKVRGRGRRSYTEFWMREKEKKMNQGKEDFICKGHESTSRCLFLLDHRVLRSSCMKIIVYEDHRVLRRKSGFRAIIEQL